MNDDDGLKCTLYFESSYKFLWSTDIARFLGVLEAEASVAIGASGIDGVCGGVSYETGFKWFSAIPNDVVSDGRCC